MKWQADQRAGFFGYVPATREQPAQPLHCCVVDIEHAREASSGIMSLWWSSRRLPEVPAFDGGLLTHWPAWAVDAFGICRQEENAVTAYRASERHG